MDILFKRDQTPGKLARVNFKLWGKIELDAEEQALMKQYRMDDAVLIEVVQPDLIRMAVGIGFLVLMFSFPLFFTMASLSMSLLLALAAGCGAAYWFVNEKRETILVKDMIHGRYFTCKSVIELAQKEAWLGNAVSVFRQVMEGAKHWDGTERLTVEALPKDEAKQMLLRL